MKKVLLLSTLFAGIAAKSQTFTVNDTSYTGLSANYFVMDSSAVTHAAVTGNGVTWDYSTLTAYENATLPNVVQDASGTTNASSYPMAVYNDDLSTGASVYFTNSADSITVYGFVFMADGMEVIMKHDLDPLKAMEFPMAVGDSYTDATAGELEVASFPSSTSGTATVSVDGFGTLNISGNTHTNILRVKLVEAIDATITFPMPSTGTVTRTVYSYYDFAASKQPLLIHANIAVDTDLLVDDYTAVYYSGTPDYFLGVDGMSNVTKLSILPNPSNDVVTITTDGTADKLTVYNLNGQIITSINNPQGVETLSVSELPAGTYLIKLTKEGVVTEEKLVVE